MISRFFRLVNIFRIFFKYGLDEIAVTSLHATRSAKVLKKVFFWRDLSRSRGERLRIALEKLGPIFVKFGQILSTRRDLLPPDLVAELEKLQDRVPPFSSALAIEQIKKGLGAHPNELFAQFDEVPVASASIAQVHFAVLKDGKEVAVKVLRPDLATAIDKDLDLMYLAAEWLSKFWADAKRLRAREVVAEFDKYLHDELDLMHEAANASQLRRNFANSDLLIIPEIYWDYCSPSIMVMERMKGIPISQIQQLVDAGVNLKKLSSDGVEIFFTQVFRDGFFHADMHPGNIMVSIEPATFGRYIALDFGIVGTLNDFDKDYLSQNFLAFFKRDYKRVAEAHIESGWAPKNTRVDELESAVRACCEPIFDRPLKDISFGQVLLRLFQTSRRFDIQIQPQLVLLQKTLLNIEGLGRQLDPELDLWVTAKPILERWMSEQIGWRGFMQQMKVEVPRYSKLLPQIPRLVHQVLSQTVEDRDKDQRIAQMEQLITEQRKTNKLLSLVIYFCIGVAVGVLILQFLNIYR